MARSNVVPFRRRPPSRREVEAYRWVTRNWSPGLRRLICPQYHPSAEESFTFGEGQRDLRR